MPTWVDRAQQLALLTVVALYSAGYAASGLALLLLVVIAEVVITRRPPWMPTRMDVPIVLFVGAFLVAGWVSPYRPLALGSTGLAAVTIYLAFVPLARLVTRPGFLRTFLLVWVAGAAVVAAWAILTYLQTRRPAFAPELGQNAVGTTLLIGLILGFGMARFFRGRARLALSAVTTLTGVGLIFTFTRGAWLGAATGVLTLAAAMGRRQVWTASLLVAALVLGAALVSGPGSGDLVSRAASIASLEANENRIRFLETAWQIFRDHPVTGTGLNTFALVFPQYRPDDPFGTTQPFAHNIFLNMAAEGGILGLGAFTLAVGIALAGGWRWYTGAADVDARILAATVGAAYVGALVHQLFDGTLISVHLGVGMWMLMAVLVRRP